MLGCIFLLNKMRKEIIETIEIPAGIEAEVDGNMVKIKKGSKETKRAYSGFNLKKEGNSLVLSCKKATKNEKKMIETIKAHIKNMILGLGKNFVYKLKICAVHFPMAVSIDKEKKELLIKNFLGEVKPRTAKILEGAEVKIDKDVIIIESHDTEIAGQTAANIEKATRVRNRDRRIFQDGIFITDKPE